MNCDVQFDEAKHGYTVNGNAVPNVTSICAPLGADYDDPDDAIELKIDVASERGTILHAYLAHRLGGGDPCDFEMPSAYGGYADAVDLFLEEHEIAPYLIETPLGCEKFAGTPDLVAQIDGEFTIADWKFVSQIAKSKVMAQLGGYLDLCEQNGIFPSALVAVQFLKTGLYRLYKVDKESAETAFRLCREVYAVKTAKHPAGKIGFASFEVVKRGAEV